MNRRAWFFSAGIILAGWVMTGCDEGPAGPPGQDANATCTECHASDTRIHVRQVQYAASVHRNGGNFRRGSTAFCSACHSHDGFVERIEAGTLQPEAGFDNPSPINCRTCHRIHDTYTEADLAFRATEPPLLFSSHLESVDFGAAGGNLCAQCHTARDLNPVPVIDGDPVTPTSSRYGYHHGPQGLVLMGFGAFEFSGAETVPDGPSSHGNLASNPKTCVTCHMAAARGDEAGGHTWNMSWGVEGERGNNTAGCATANCHTNGLDSFDDPPYMGAHTQSDILAKLIELETELVRIGIKREMSPGYTLHELSLQINANVEYPANVAAAFVNWQMFAEDRSLGIHNPAYAWAVLSNTIDVVKSIPVIVASRR